MAIEISAIICTFNRASYLRKALQSLVEQTLDIAKYEILVVDNHSTDDTKSVVTEEFSHISNLCYFYEPVLGLSQARNTGWQNAKGKYVAYLDDDAIASPHWLEKILQVFETVNPQPGAVGGKVEPIWEAERPNWLTDDFLLYLSVLDLSEYPRPLKDEEILVGANISFPRRLLEKLHGFNPMLGRTGNKLLSCEETSLFQEIDNMGYQRFYHPEISVKHHIHSNRIDSSWFRRRFFWQGVSEAVLHIESQSLSTSARTKLTLKFLHNFIKNPKAKISTLLKTVHKSNLSLQSQTQWELGYIAGLLGFKN
ncbi:family 2 glycosyl transferase [Nostoc carneum NIES-2107]|nr:family 2 glycosyl transferase [Nostoc carneum NIES-2107]